MSDSSQAKIARVIYNVWKDQNQPDTVAACDVLEYYRQKIGAISSTDLDEVLAVMEDDSGPMPFLRVSIPNNGKEMAGLGLKNIVAVRLLTLAGDTSF